MRLVPTTPTGRVKNIELTATGYLMLTVTDVGKMLKTYDDDQLVAMGDLLLNAVERVWAERNGAS